MHALQTKKKTMATIKQQTSHPTMQALQTKLQNSIHRHQLIKKQQKTNIASITNQPETNTSRQPLNKKDNKTIQALQPMQQIIKRNHQTQKQNKKIKQ